MRNNIGPAFRVLKKFRLYTAINVAGLALSLACATIVIRYIHQELTVDSFVPHLDRTYILTREYENRATCWGDHWNSNNDPDFIDPTDSPAVEQSMMFALYPENNFLTKDNRTFSAKTVTVDGDFLAFFPFPLVEGKGTLDAPADAIITRKLSERIFGKESPIGKSIDFSWGSILTVVGVIDEPQCKTSLSFDLLISRKQEEVRVHAPQSMVRLVPGADVNQLNKENEAFMYSRSWRSSIRMQFYPFKGLYMDRSIEKYHTQDDILREGNPHNLWVLSLVVMLLLVVGVFNFINIYTVLMLKRAREFGVKKVYGASFGDIFRQIYTENLVLTLFSLLLAWSFIELTEAAVSLGLGIEIRSNWWFDVQYSLLILFFFPLLISIYPAVKYRRALPVTSLRTVYMQGHSSLARVLFLWIQYVITFSLVVVSLFFMKQLHYMLNTDLGYRTQDIMQCMILREPVDGKQYDRNRELRNQVDRRMEESNLFEYVASGNFPYKLTPNIPFQMETGEYKQAASLNVSQACMELYEFQLLEGRIWNDTIDKFAQYKVIINETAKKTFGVKDIFTERLQCENRLWYSFGEPDMDKNPPQEIVGVIKDFKTDHLSKANVPVVITYTMSGAYEPALLAIKPGKRQEAISFLEALYYEMNDTGDFEYSFLEDEVAAMYDEDKRVARIYMIFAGIAVFVSCLGLFGLSLFDIRQYYRSIALRKINGATPKEIWPLLVRKYMWIMAASFAVAIPLSYLAIWRYLESFAHKAPVSWWLFAVAAACVILVSYVTLVWQVRKAIRINPAEVLKNE